MEPVTAEPSAAERRLVVSVVIPALNEEEPIGEVVRAVAAQPVDEIIVVDNGSTDRTAERAAAAGARVVWRATARLRPGVPGRRAGGPARLLGDPLPRRRRQRLPGVHSGAAGADRRRHARFRHRLAAARPARGRQHDAAAARRRPAGGAAVPAGVRGALHRHEPVPGDPPRCALPPRHGRGDLRLEPGDADACRPRWAAHPGNPRRSSTSRGRSFQGLGKPCRALCGRRCASRRHSCASQPRAAAAERRRGPAKHFAVMPPGRAACRAVRRCDRPGRPAGAAAHPRRGCGRPR